MRYLLFLIFLTSCARQSFEMEEMVSDVIKSKRGVHFDIEPEEEKK